MVALVYINPTIKCMHGQWSGFDLWVITCQPVMYDTLKVITSVVKVLIILSPLTGGKIEVQRPQLPSFGLNYNNLTMLPLTTWQYNFFVYIMLIEDPFPSSKSIVNCGGLILQFFTIIIFNSMFRNSALLSRLYKNQFMYDFPRFATCFIVQMEKHTKTGLIQFVLRYGYLISQLLIIGTFI